MARRGLDLEQAGESAELLDAGRLRFNLVRVRLFRGPVESVTGSEWQSERLRARVILSPLERARPVANKHEGVTLHAPSAQCSNPLAR